MVANTKSMKILDIWNSYRNVHNKMNDAFKIALSQYGVKEIPGSEHSPEVLKYFHDGGFTEIRDDETSWCSAFMCWCMFKAGIPHTGSLAARSWLNWGKQVHEAQTGDVVIYWRESLSSWQGHVGFFIRKEDSYIYTLGGNQSNSVCILKYSDKQLLGYRRWGI